VAQLQRPVLDEDGRDGAARAIEAGLDHVSLGQLVRVGLEVEHLGLNREVLQELVDPLLGLADTFTKIVSPPHCSETSPCSESLLRISSGLTPGLSILLTATMIGTFASLAWLMASIVCGIGPSSAATTRTTMSVIWAPRARMAVKASWPGVSRKTTSPFSVNL